MALPMRSVLNAALDELEAALENQKPPEPTPAEIAAGLDPKDFGDSINARIGLNYMKGEIEVLQEERNTARQRLVEEREAHRLLQEQLRTAKWENEKLQRKITIIEAELPDLEEGQD